MFNKIKGNKGLRLTRVKLLGEAAHLLTRSNFHVCMIYISNRKVTENITFYNKHDTVRVVCRENTHINRQQGKTKLNIIVIMHVVSVFTKGLFIGKIAIMLEGTAPRVVAELIPRWLCPKSCEAPIKHIVFLANCLIVFCTALMAFVCRHGCRHQVRELMSFRSISFGFQRYQ